MLLSLTNQASDISQVALGAHTVFLQGRQCRKGPIQHAFSDPPQSGAERQPIRSFQGRHGAECRAKRREQRISTRMSFQTNSGPTRGARARAPGAGPATRQLQGGPHLPEPQSTWALCPPSALTPHLSARWFYQGCSQAKPQKSK